MFIELDVHPGADRMLPRRKYLAVAISAQSEADACYVDGQLISVGSPRLYDGAERSPRIVGLRTLYQTQGRGMIKLLGIVDPCGLSAIPKYRAPFHQERNLYPTLHGGAGGTAYAETFVCAGRRHTSFKLYTDVAITINVKGYARAGEGSVQIPLVVDRLMAADSYDAFEIGGTDHEECYDAYYVTVTRALGAASAYLWMTVEAYGELGR